MTMILLFLLPLAALAAFWLARQRLTAKPWLEEGEAGLFPGGEAVGLAPAKIGLFALLAVIGALFALFLSAYAMRMGGSDWRSIPVPRLLWPNTGMLAMTSVALYWARAGADRGEEDQVRLCVGAAGIFGAAFLAGQVLVWRALSGAGYGLSSNPANAFFYLITGLHAVHVLGGLVGLGRTIDTVRRGADRDRIRLSVELCAAYWHFLLVVWLVLLALIAGWAEDFVAICRQLLT